MAGLYVHIPFCRKACTYCDFHFSTSLKSREALLDAMRREVEARQRRSRGRSGTIYFGGGHAELAGSGRDRCFHCPSPSNSSRSMPNAEVTLEANPDDINRESLLKWKELGITRISLGTQSFRDDRLRFMGRAHDAADQAIRSIDLIAKAGFASWTIDLIYGLPKMTLAEWEEQLTIALDHGMPHLSAYCLTVEPRTALAHQVAKGLVHMPADDDQSAQFDRLMDRMDTAGLDHYEISNFGKPGHWSRHNTAYWEGVPYLGIGPSAHSFNGRERRWNVSNNAQYMTALSKGEPYWELELLTAAQRTNEALLTGLRTSAGVPIDRLELDVMGRNSSDIERYVSSGHLLLVDGRLVLTKAGRHFADRIAADLFVSDDAG
ncbi:MAG: radical SAM family heme chaperone HemW [Flavobacteriales bacterium]|nr:radical SAM family heme chaperone HemW [Flavobacteriales bacterium]